MAQTTVTVQDNGSTVVVLDRATVATITSNRPTTSTGGAMGVQGPQGETGLSGGGSVAPIAFSYGDASSAIYTPASAGTLTVARVVITTPFDGTGAALALGTVADADSIMPAAQIDPAEAGEYEATADVALDAAEAVRLSITPGTGASAGAGLIYLTFIAD